MKRTWQKLREYALCKEFLSEPSEVHALWFGFYSSFFRLRRARMSEELREQVESEYHYFTAGFFLGRVVQAVLVLLGVKLII